MENDMSVLLPELISDAIKENDLEALKAVGYCDAINTLNAENELPLNLCIKHNRREAFMILLEHGAWLRGVEDRPDVLEPLVLLARTGKIEWIINKIDWWRMDSHTLNILKQRNVISATFPTLSLSIRK